ncbi:hypothetical protein EV715DRAFT_266613 [Schizophyllum commune]
MDPTSKSSVLSTILRILADPPTTPAGNTEALAQCIEAFYQEHQVIVRILRPCLDGTIAARVEADPRVQELRQELATAKARAEFDANVSNIRMETLRKEMKQTKLLAESQVRAAEARATEASNELAALKSRTQSVQIQGPNPGHDADPNYDADPGCDADPGYDADHGYDADTGYDADPGYDADTGCDADLNCDADIGYDADLNYDIITYYDANIDYGAFALREQSPDEREQSPASVDPPRASVNAFESSVDATESTRTEPGPRPSKRVRFSDTRFDSSSNARDDGSASARGDGSANTRPDGASGSRRDGASSSRDDGASGSPPGDTSGSHSADMSGSRSSMTPAHASARLREAGTDASARLREAGTDASRVAPPVEPLTEGRERTQIKASTGKAPKAPTSKTLEAPTSNAPEAPASMAPRTTTSKASTRKARKTSMSTALKMPPKQETVIKCNEDGTRICPQVYRTLRLLGLSDPAPARSIGPCACWVSRTLCLSGLSDLAPTRSLGPFVGEHERLAPLMLSTGHRPVLSHDPSDGALVRSVRKLVHATDNRDPPHSQCRTVPSARRWCRHDTFGPVSVCQQCYRKNRKQKGLAT